MTCSSTSFSCAETISNCDSATWCFSKWDWEECIDWISSTVWFCIVWNKCCIIFIIIFFFIKLNANLLLLGWWFSWNDSFLFNFISGWCIFNSWNNCWCKFFSSLLFCNCYFNFWNIFSNWCFIIILWLISLNWLINLIDLIDLIVLGKSWIFWISFSNWNSTVLLWYTSLKIIIDFSFYKCFNYDLFT